MSLILIKICIFLFYTTFFWKFYNFILENTTLFWKFYNFILENTTLFWKSFFFKNNEKKFTYSSNSLGSYSKTSFPFFVSLYVGSMSVSGSIFSIAPFS